MSEDNESKEYKLDRVQTDSVSTQDSTYRQESTYIQDSARQVHNIY